MSRVMLLKTVGENGEAYGGFVWPLTVGAIVKPGQWDSDPKRECGAGLHGLLWGEGDGNLICWENTAKWLVVSADAADVRPPLGGKSRFREGRVEFVGNRKEATDFIMANGASAHAVVGCCKMGGCSSTLTGGGSSTLTGGDSSTLTGGESSTLTWRVWDKTHRRIFAFYVGEGGIKPNVAYRFVDGKPQEVSK